MAIRADFGTVAQPLRWLAYPATWAVLAATAVWLKSRSTGRTSVSPLSTAWLVDMERQSTRTREL